MKAQVSNHWELSSSKQCRKFLILVVPMPGELPQVQSQTGFLTQNGLQLLAEFKKTNGQDWSLENVHQTYTQCEVNLMKASQPECSSCEPASAAELVEQVSAFIAAQPSTYLFADLERFPFAALAPSLNAVSLDEKLQLFERHCTQVCSLLANLKMKLQRVQDCALVVLLNFTNTQNLWPTLLLSTEMAKHPVFAKEDSHRLDLPRDISKIPHLFDACRAVSESSIGFHLPALDDLGFALQRLARVISCLRGPNGCPWDIEQNTTSLVPFMIEEAYEAAEAADLWVSGRDPTGAKFADELGDVLLQIVLNAQIAAEQKAFDLQTVIDGLTEKMIRRHPHVFETATSQAHLASSEIKDAQGVKEVWENVKRSESLDHAQPSHDLLHKAAKKKSLPTLEFVAEISKRANKLGFCWQSIAEVWQDVENEVLELKSEIFVNERNWKKVEDELGDVVFALANVLVHIKQKLNGPEDLSFDTAARKSAAKFLNRFKEMEIIYLENTGAPLSESIAKTLDLDTWNKLWSDAKKRRYR